jgi:hypothetical protein
MPQVEITLEQMSKFLDDWKPIKYRALQDVVGVLEETLENDVFTTHDDTVNIPTKSHLQRYIKAGGQNHNPPRTPVKGNSYSPEYLRRKRTKSGFYKPHVYEEFGFYHGITTRVKYGSVVMEAKMPETAEDKGFDYLSHHEKRRSVLKLAFLRGWQKIINKIIDRLKKEAKES